MGILSRLRTRYPKALGLLSFEFPLREINSEIANSNSNNTIIPKNVYQTWDFNKIGKSHYSEWMNFKKINSDYNFVFFNKSQRDQYMLENWRNHKVYEIYEMSRFGPMAVDIFRYCLIYDKGGIYFDINKCLSKPINDFISEGCSFFFSYERDISYRYPELQSLKTLKCPHNFVLNWAFGFKQRHPVLLNAVDKVSEYQNLFKGHIFAKPSQAIVKYTGTNLFTEAIHHYISKNPNDKFCDSDVNFGGSGITSMKNSWVRYAKVPAYTRARNDFLF